MYRIKKPIFKYSDYFVKYYDSIPLTYPYDMIESTKMFVFKSFHILQYIQNFFNTLL